MKLQVLVNLQKKAKEKIEINEKIFDINNCNALLTEIFFQIQF